ncbi:MAG TPA: acyltransferase family protein [Solirubrobacteraceae bacterium]|jgi:peptidoglycan/LPS O-acetylase OafA/YrhL|nr:acyltransferase family protein [Solirubrobacteraceae bacterium]
MPRRESRRRPHVALPQYPGLDGLRALAVVAVLLYHGGVAWSGGGFLGVEMFFVLSGFLITSLLVAEFGESGRIALRAFWARRARRLLPALFALVAAIGVYYALAGPTKAIPGLQGDGISTLLYFSNWHQVAAGTSYFAASGPVSPLQHTWSLAIEEQFYVLWPLLVLAVLGAARRRGASERRSLQVLLGLSLSGAVIASVEMALLFASGRGLDRVYYGTDTRATGLLLGASLAIAMAIRRRWPTTPTPRLSPRWARHALGAASVLVLPLLAAGIVLADGDDAWIYPFGMLATDAVMVVLIAAVVFQPRALGARLLSVAPLRAVGKISYGLYLWHFPLFLWLDEGSTGQRGTALLILRLAVTLAVSLLSYFVIEQPIRQRRRPAWVVRGLAPVGAGAAVVSLLMASAATSLPVGVPAAAKLPKAPAHLQGSDGPCQVSLSDSPQLGMAPVGTDKVAKFEYGALGKSTLVWNGSTTKTFETCPPKRVLVIGDSLAFTLGLPMMDDEDRYGVQISNAALLGCAFSTRGQLNVNGAWEDPPAGCTTALTQWENDVKRVHAQQVVVELGYRDEFDWRWGNKTVHLGMPAFDAYLQGQIDHFVSVLSRGGVKVLFLSVPYTHPPDRADGTPSPAASSARHADINAMLEAEAKRHAGSVRVLDIDKTVSPDNRYDAKVKGQLCRFDGIHFSVFCAKLLEPTVLGEARKQLAARH